MSIKINEKIKSTHKQRDLDNCVIFETNLKLKTITVVS